MKREVINQRIEKIKDHLTKNPSDYQSVIALFRYNDKLANKIKEERQNQVFIFIKKISK